MKLVYTSPVPYRSFTQRPHRFVQFFNERSGGRTLWIDPYPGRLPRVADLHKASQRAYHRPTEAVETCAAVGADPLMGPAVFRQLAWRRVLARVKRFVDGCDWLLVAGRPSYLALHLLQNTAPKASCYDAMDDFPEFYSGLSRWLSRRIEGRIANSVDAILVSSDALLRKFTRQGFAAELLRNGLDPSPEAAPDRARPQLVFGYVGTIGAWFDWQLLAAMARDLPEVLFQLIGPVLAPAPSLPANVRLCGERPNEELPNRLRRFTAGLIPFKINRLTAAVDPIKYYEYRSAGLPVISTRFGDMAVRGTDQQVHLVDQRTDFQDLLRQIRAHAGVSCEALRGFQAENSWRSRFASSRFFNTQVFKAHGGELGRAFAL